MHLENMKERTGKSWEVKREESESETELADRQDSLGLGRVGGKARGWGTVGCSASCQLLKAQKVFSTSSDCSCFCCLALVRIFPFPHLPNMFALVLARASSFPFSLLSSPVIQAPG